MKKISVQDASLIGVIVVLLWLNRETVAREITRSLNGMVSSPIFTVFIWVAIIYVMVRFLMWAEKKVRGA